MTTSAPEKEPDLSKLRSRIDQIDTRILELINERIEIGRKVGQIKKQTGGQILDRSREAAVIQNLFNINQGPATNELLQYVFNVIITATREIQRPRTVSFLGPRASYSHIAALTHFRQSAHFAEQPNLYEVFRQVDRGESHFGVVPIENSTEGAVSHTLDLFSEFDLNICAEHYEPISHDLISKTGDAADITTIISHPQAIASAGPGSGTGLGRSVSWRPPHLPRRPIWLQRINALQLLPQSRPLIYTGFFPLNPKLKISQGT